MTNEEIARRVRTHAGELARGGENLYRVRAYRRAAVAVLGMDRPVKDVLDAGGRAALAAVPGIGESLAETIDVFATLGMWAPRSERGASAPRLRPTPAAALRGLTPPARRNSTTATASATR